jgi:hypothetical protein
MVPRTGRWQTANVLKKKTQSCAVFSSPARNPNLPLHYTLAWLRPPHLSMFTAHQWRVGNAKLKLLHARLFFLIVGVTDEHDAERLAASALLQNKQHIRLDHLQTAARDSKILTCTYTAVIFYTLHYVTQ